MYEMIIVYWSFAQSVVKILIGSLLLVKNIEDSKQQEYNVKRSECCN